MSQVCWKEKQRKQEERWENTNDHLKSHYWKYKAYDLKLHLTNSLQDQINILLYENLKWFQMMHMWQQTSVAQWNTDFKDTQVVNIIPILELLRNEG